MNAPRSNNHQRVLADVVSLIAWHDPFRITQDTYGVHAEISFSEGRMGGDDPEIPFTFNVSLRKALLTIKLEEPLSIERASVARGIPAKQAEYTRVLRAKDEVRKKVGINGSVTPALMTAALKGDFSSVTEVSKEEELRVVETIPEILVTGRPDGIQGYAWELEPLLSDRLKGQPWDPVEPPRMRIIAPPSSGIDPSIRVEVRCALEDLHISSMIPKDKGVLEKLLGLKNREINEAAAIQHLKRILSDVELLPGKMDNRFNTIIIADVLALSS